MFIYRLDLLDCIDNILFVILVVFLCFVILCFYIFLYIFMRWCWRKIIGKVDIQVVKKIKFVFKNLDNVNEIKSEMNVML